MSSVYFEKHHSISGNPQSLWSPKAPEFCNNDYRISNDSAEIMGLINGCFFYKIELKFYRISQSTDGERWLIQRCGLDGGCPKML